MRPRHGDGMLHTGAMSTVIVGAHWGVGLGAAAFWRDGQLVFATAEERLSRVKGSRCCPVQALEAGLAALGIAAAEVARWVVAGPMALGADPVWQAWCARQGIAPASIFQVPLQDAQWAQAWGLSPHDEAAVWCSEPHARAGGGERGRWGWQRRGGVPGQAERGWHEAEPGEVGLGAVYGAVTRWLGLRPESDEWRVMGAAAWGDPARHDAAWSQALGVGEAGALHLTPGVWQHAEDGGLALVAQAGERLFGPPRGAGQPWQAGHFDLAASVQALAERHLLAGLHALHRRTGQRAVCLSGSVMLNSLANGRAAREGPFEAVYVPFAPDASGAAIGAALLGARAAGWTGRLHDRLPDGVSPCLGRRFTFEEARTAAQAAGLTCVRLDEATLLSDAVQRLVQGAVIGWFQGRSEFGPRALGARSIVADPRVPGMQDRINRAVKFREPFRPFAPAVLAESQAAWFMGERQPASPYMDKVLPFRPERRAEVPAVVHRDGTGRLQTVARGQAPGRWRGLIEAFSAQTGVPMLLDTSFNVDGEPVVDSPADAVRTMVAAGLDALFIEDLLVLPREDCGAASRG